MVTFLSLAVLRLVGAARAAVGLSQVENRPGVVFGSPRSSGRLENLNAPHSVRVYSTPIEQKIRNENYGLQSAFRTFAQSRLAHV